MDAGWVRTILPRVLQPTLVAPPPGRLVLAAVLGGTLVGVAEGMWAAASAHLDAGTGMGAVALAAGGDALVGLLLGLAGELAWRLFAWGARRSATFGARLAAATLLAALPAMVAVAGVVATASRVNRLLAGVVVAAAVASGAAVVLALLPAVTRLVARFVRREAVATSSAPAGRWLWAPLVCAAALIAEVVLVWRTRAPLRGARLLQREVTAGVVAGLLPVVALAATRVRWPAARVPLRRAVTLAYAVLAAGVAAVAIARWQTETRYLPGPVAAVLLGIAATTAALVYAAHGRWRLLTGLGLLALVAAPIAVVGAASGEPARKALAAQPTLVGPLLAEARAAFDADHDGYPRRLGGGDCNDRDPAINPGALDWPEDGIDQDCDGADATVTALGAQPFVPVPPPVPADLSVVFITVDTLRADHLGCYGYSRPTSPVLDGLAAEGALFVNGWAHAPSTRYSMPAIATSRWPSAVPLEDCDGCSSWWHRIAPSARTIGQAFKSAGYDTAAFYAYSYFLKSERRGYERGIDDYRDHCAALHTNVAGPAESIGSSARQMSDDAVGYLDGRAAAGGRKFFLWLHYYDPHLSYERHPEVPSFGARPSDLYDGEIRFTDQQIGRVLDALKRNGLWNQTAVVVTGDHGEGLGERGIEAHGYHLYPPQTKVPFIVRVPGLAPQRVQTPVGHVDLAPTLLNLARAQAEPTFLGRSFVDLLQGDAAAQGAPRAPVFQEVSYEGDNKKRAFVDGHTQLIWNWTPHNTTECYDLRDPSATPADVWGSARGQACVALKADLRRMVAALALPQDFRDRMTFGVAAAPGAFAPPQHPVHAEVGGAVTYLGWDGPEQVTPGAQVEVVFRFRSARPLQGWRPFFHWADARGTFRNLDHVPVEGVFPIERWKAGQEIRDRFRFQIDPAAAPGPATIFFGLYRGGERLPVVPASAGDAENRVVAVRMEVAKASGAP